MYDTSPSNLHYLQLTVLYKSFNDYTYTVSFENITSNDIEEKCQPVVSPILILPWMSQVTQLTAHYQTCHHPSLTP